jgi:hypothetical protein
MRVNVPLTFVLGAAAGYVAGSAAGRRRYEQIRSAADTFVHDQVVRDTASRVASTAASAATTAGAATVSKAKDVASTVKDAISDKDEADEAKDTDDEHHDSPDEAAAHA